MSWLSSGALGAGLGIVQGLFGSKGGGKAAPSAADQAQANLLAAQRARMTKYVNPLLAKYFEEWQQPASQTLTRQQFATEREGIDKYIEGAKEHYLRTLRERGMQDSGLATGGTAALEAARVGQLATAHHGLLEEERTRRDTTAERIANIASGLGSQTAMLGQGYSGIATREQAAEQAALEEQRRRSQELSDLIAAALYRPATPTAAGTAGPATTYNKGYSLLNTPYPNVSLPAY